LGRPGITWHGTCVVFPVCEQPQKRAAPARVALPPPPSGRRVSIADEPEWDYNLTLTGRDDVLAVIHDVEPGHARWRRALQEPFGPRAMAELEPFVKDRAQHLVTAVAGQGECEAMAEVVLPFAADVLLRLLGLPGDHRDRLILLLDTVFVDVSDPTPQWDLLSYLVEEIMSERPPRLATQLLTADDPLDEDGAAALYLLLALAGVETVAATLGYALLRLARSPQLRVLLRDDPTQIPNFLEEVVRLEAPVTVSRDISKQVTVAGVTLPAGCSVRLDVKSANIEDGGDQVSVTEDGKVRRRRHWGYGGGIRRCPGVHLARTEMSELVAEWLRLIPEFEPAPGFVPEIVETRAVPRLATLPLRWRQAMNPLAPPTDWTGTAR
jgi:cytochrome P450